MQSFTLVILMSYSRVIVQRHGPTHLTPHPISNHTLFQLHTMQSLLPFSAVLDSDKAANPNNKLNNKLHVLEIGAGTYDACTHTMHTQPLSRPQTMHTHP